MKHQPSFFEQAFDQTKTNCHNTMDASAKLLSDGWNETGKRARQAGAVVDGLIVGGIKEIPNQVINHPKETAEKVALGVGAGLAIGLLPLEIPVVATGAAIVGTGMLCAYVWDVGQRLGSNKELHKALDDVYKGGDAKAMKKALPVIESSLGKESFDFGLTMMCGNGGYKLGSGLKQLAVPALKACTAGGPINAAAMAERPGMSPSDNFKPYHKMEGRGIKGEAEASKPAEQKTSKPAEHASESKPESKTSDAKPGYNWREDFAYVKNGLSELQGKTVEELANFSDKIIDINRSLRDISKAPERLSLEDAKSLLCMHKTFRQIIKPVVEAVENGAKNLHNLTEEGAETHDRLASALENVIKDQIYDLSSNNLNIRSDKWGIQVQQRILQALKNLFSEENGLKPTLKKMLMEQNKNWTAADAGKNLRGWRQIGTGDGSTADMAGIDNLLANEITGDAFPIDVTMNASGLNPKAFVETISQNPLLNLGESKNVPTDRLKWVIAAVKETTMIDMAGDIMKGKQLEQEQLAKIVAGMITGEAPLNLFNVRIPTSRPGQNLSRKLFELWRFSEELKDNGMNDWSNKLHGAMKSVIEEGRKTFGKDSLGRSIWDEAMRDWNQFIETDFHKRS